ncbi:hypothetical protein D1872_341350 [compost metagenome]
MDAVFEPHFLDLPLDLRQIRPFADKEQLGRDLPVDHLEYVHHVADPFHRPEIGNVHQHLFPRIGKIRFAITAFPRIV